MRPALRRPARPALVSRSAGGLDLRRRAPALAAAVALVGAGAGAGVLAGPAAAYAGPASTAAAAVTGTSSHHVALPAALPAGWAATATKAIGLRGTRLGATRAAKPLQVAVTLRPHVAAMRHALAAIDDPSSAQYHHFLTPQQVRSRFAPSAADAAAVTRYLRAQGLTGVTVAPDRLLVTAHATVGRAEQAFATRIVSYRIGARTLFANRTAALVPTRLSGVVGAVLGLDDTPVQAGVQRVTHPSRTAAAGSPSLSGLYPTQFQTTYDAVGTPTGASTAIAILTAGDISQVVPDLRQAEAQEGTTQVPVTTVQVGAPGTDATGLDEWDMDTQASSMMAGDVSRMYLYNATDLTDDSIIAAVNQFVSDDKAQAMSASIGECEVLASLSGTESTLDTIALQGSLQGQTLFASSGDEGDACSLLVNLGAPVGVPQVEWPAAGEYTTAVGGTSLVADADGNRVLEPSWLGGGGGTSLFEPAGDWTAATDPLHSAGLRAVPDVALDADPDTAPVLLVVDGQPASVGGTSLSSPLMLGVWARLESAHGNGLGLAAPALYGVYDKVNPGVSTPVGTVPTLLPQAVPGFYDVTLGTNGLYVATPGWDYTTGLGAPDVAQLDQALS